MFLLLWITRCIVLWITDSNIPGDWKIPPIGTHRKPESNRQFWVLVSLIIQLLLLGQKSDRVDKTGGGEKEMKGVAMKNELVSRLCHKPSLSSFVASLVNPSIRFFQWAYCEFSHKLYRKGKKNANKPSKFENYFTIQRGRGALMGISYPHKTYRNWQILVECG